MKKKEMTVGRWVAWVLGALIPSLVLVPVFLGVGFIAFSFGPVKGGVLGSAPALFLVSLAGLTFLVTLWLFIFFGRAEVYARRSLRIFVAAPGFAGWLLLTAVVMLYLVQDPNLFDLVRPPFSLLDIRFGVIAGLSACVTYLICLIRK